MAFGKKKKKEEDSPAMVPDDSGVAESDIEETIRDLENTSKHLVQELETVQKHLMEANEKISKLEADMITLEGAHTSITGLIMKNADQIDGLTQRMDGVGKAVSKIRETIGK